MSLLPEENKLPFVVIRMLLFGAFITSLYGSFQYTRLLQESVNTSLFLTPILVLYQSPLTAIYLLIIPAILCIFAYLVHKKYRR